eukprot:scaffold26650_cov63-Phaeocystis_antarctica.AAC.6
MGCGLDASVATRGRCTHKGRARMVWRSETAQPRAPKAAGPAHGEARLKRVSSRPAWRLLVRGSRPVWHTGGSIPLKLKRLRGKRSAPRCSSSKRCRLKPATVCDRGCNHRRRRSPVAILTMAKRTTAMLTMAILTMAILTMAAYRRRRR